MSTHFFLSDLLASAAYNLVAVIWSSPVFATSASTSLSGNCVSIGFPSCNSRSFVNIMATGLGAASSCCQRLARSASKVAFLFAITTLSLVVRPSLSLKCSESSLTFGWSSVGSSSSGIELWGGTGGPPTPAPFQSGAWSGLTVILGIEAAQPPSPTAGRLAPKPGGGCTIPARPPKLADPRGATNAGVGAAPPKLALPGAVPSGASKPGNCIGGATVTGDPPGGCMQAPPPTGGTPRMPGAHGLNKGREAPAAGKPFPKAPTWVGRPPPPLPAKPGGGTNMRAAADL